MKPILVLLPGLDGSGQLFSPLLAALGNDFDCRVLALPTDGEQTQLALAQRLLLQLPKQRFVLLAESFSGAIAAEIATMQPPNLAGLILVATFLQTPRPWLLKVPKPVAWLGWRLHRPLAAVWWPFCGYRSDVSTRGRVLAALTSLPWSTLWQRLQSIRTLMVRPVNIHCPAVSIHAEADRLIPPSARAQLDRVIPPRSMRGPHFLLQSEPVAAATQIRDWFTVTFPETG